MDIDFLKNKNKKIFKSSSSANADFEYSQPDLTPAKKNKLPKQNPVKKEKKIKPEKKFKLIKTEPSKEMPPAIVPPKRENISVVPKISWWQRMRAKFKKKPKEVYQAPKPDNATYQLIKPEQKAIDKKPIKIQEKVVVQPAISHQQNLKALDQHIDQKFRKKELTNNFLGVNLIPDKLIVDLSPITKIRRIIWSGIFSLIFIIIISVGILFYQTYLINQVRNTQDNIKKTEDEIAGYTAWQKDVIAFNDKIEGVTKLLNTHIYWLSFFKALEEYTLPDVYYGNLSGDVSGTFTLTATAPDFKTVSEQIALFRQADFISNVVIISATNSSAVPDKETKEKTNETTTNEQAVKFDISLTVKPQIFYVNNSL